MPVSFSVPFSVWLLRVVLGDDGLFSSKGARLVFWWFEIFSSGFRRNHPPPSVFFLWSLLKTSPRLPFLFFFFRSVHPMYIKWGWDCVGCKCAAFLVYRGGVVRLAGEASGREGGR